MNGREILNYAWRALFVGHWGRTAWVLMAMAVGVAGVVLLTALGEGARQYVVERFSSLGTHLLIVLPGRNETTGGHPPITGETSRDLTLEDALAFLRAPAIGRVAPVAVGAAPVAHGGREREVTVLGSTTDFFRIRQLSPALGRFLPEGDPRRGSAVCVLGEKVRRELFGNGPVLGAWVRIGQRRFRVIGILADQGRSIGLDLEDVAVVPVASAMQMFNSAGLFRVLAEARTREEVAEAEKAILSIIRDRHQGEEDVTIIAQDAMLATFDKVLKALTWAVGGVAAVSLVVAGILIMNVMLISVAQRRAEIGLLKALGAKGDLIARLFVTEALLLSMVGAGAGLLLGLAGSWLVRLLWPVFPMQPPLWSVLAALVVAFVSALFFGALPARRAARLDPVAALARR